MSSSRGATILVAGAPGMLADALLERLAPERPVVATTLETMDLTDRSQIQARMDEIRPAAVVNCAGLTNVDDCERDPALAMAVNGNAAGVLAEECDRRGLEMIQISTDYVFDGNGGAPYAEGDPVNPVQVYGESKLRGEERVAASCARHKILRVAMLYGIHRFNFAEFVAQRIEAGEPIRAVTDNAGSPTHCRDIAEQIAGLLGRPETGVFHCAGLGGCSRMDFARRILDLWPAPDHPLRGVLQADFPQMLARRPADSRLECLRLRDLGLLRLKPWEEAVADFLADRHRKET